MTDITIYNFMMPIPSLHPDAARKAELIWCQKDRTKVWTEWMRKGKLPENGKAGCSNPVAETTSAGRTNWASPAPRAGLPQRQSAKRLQPDADAEGNHREKPVTAGSEILKAV